MSEVFRVPPHSIEAEQSLIGALFLDNEAFDRISDIVTATDFYKGHHRVIFEHIELTMATGQPADVVTVAESLSAANALEKAGGAGYLAALSQTTPTALNIRRYAEIVKKFALLRAMIRVCHEGMELAWNQGADPEVALEQIEKKVFDLRQRRVFKTPESFQQILSKVFASIDHRYHHSGEITGLSTGFKALDKMTAGFQPGDLIVIGGRPSMGKTAIAMNMAEHAALEEQKPVAIFSIEMSDMALVQRMLGSVGRVDQHKLRTGMLNDADWSSLNNAMSRLHAAPFMVEETTSLSIIELRARARRIAKENPGLGLIVVDYLQLMATHAQTQSERTSEISEISRGMKALAKELNVPVVLLSQLNRGVEARVNKRPMNSDLRDSGSIEQDADLIILMYRDDYYTEDSIAKGYAEAIVGKQRNGAVGTVFLKFVKEETRFEDTTWTPPKKERKQKKQGFVAQVEQEAAEKAQAEEAHDRR